MKLSESTKDLISKLESKFDSTVWRNILIEHLGPGSLYEKPKSIDIKSNQYNATAQEIGSFETSDGLLIGVYEIDLPSNVNLHRNRKTVRDLLTLQYKNDVSGALVVFNQKNSEKWRFTFVSGLKENPTHWKRFTYLFGKGERCKTAGIRFSKLKELTAKNEGISIEALREAFNVEKMSKEFFDTYRKHYGRFTTYLTGEDENGKKAGSKRAMNGFASFFPGESELAKKNARDFVKKMMGRIVFLYFLEKKGWLGIPENGDWGDGDEFFMSNLIKDAKLPEIFYSNILVPLFFDNLNNPNRSDDLFKIDPKAFNSGNYSKLKIPYLNGGLFSKESKELITLNFPQELFSNPDAETEDDFGFFQFLDLYNFTIDEDSKSDHTVAVDPEMMGHIFENLLEDNKEKGTFYTPKAVVEFMCQESLIEYLSTTLNANELLRKNIETLVKVPGAGMEECREYMPEIVKALKEVKICDPAIGSGAFPMGMLMEIYHLMEKMDPYSIARNAWPYNEWNKDSHKIKLNIIENSIYGVDIEKGAVDIARLRFWLSLIVDLDKPEALPNLDYKIVQGNSLLNELHINSNHSIFVDIDWDIDNKNATSSTRALMEKIANDLKKLTNSQKEYFDPHATKSEIDAKIKELKIEILLNQIELDKMKYTNSKGGKQGEMEFDEEPVSKGKAQIEEDYEEKLITFKDAIKHLKELKKSKKTLQFFNYELEFAEVLNPNINSNKGFDIVIGNPPYGQLLNDKEKDLIRRKFTELKFKLDVYPVFLLLSISLLKKSGYASFIIPNTLMDNLNLNEVRSKLLKENQLKLILDLDDKVFKSAIVHSMILGFTKEDTLMEYEVKCSSEGIDNYFLIPKSYFIKQDYNTYDLRSFHYSALISKLKNNSINFQDVIDLKQTIKTGDDENYISNRKETKRHKPILRGKDINKYSKKWNHLYVDYGPHLANAIRNDIFEQPKILIREAGKEIIATYDDENYYIMSSLYNGILINEDYDLKYILALVNSKVFQFLMKLITLDKTKGAFTKARIFHYYKLPIKVINKEKQIRFVKIVNKILSLKERDISTKNLEEQIDHLVYKLYNLEYNEVKVIDSEFNLTEEEYMHLTL